MTVGLEALVPEAEAALDLLHAWGSFPGVSGMDTVLRLAVRTSGADPEVL